MLFYHYDEKVVENISVSALGIGQKEEYFQ